jgi:hypothetical protein
LKWLLSSFKQSSHREKEREKEKEGKRVLSKYITCEKLIQGQSDLLGLDFGQIKISDICQPRFFLIVGRLKLIWSSPKGDDNFAMLPC